MLTGTSKLKSVGTSLSNVLSLKFVRYAASLFFTFWNTIVTGLGGVLSRTVSVNVCSPLLVPRANVVSPAENSEHVMSLPAASSPSCLGKVTSIFAPSSNLLMVVNSRVNLPVSSFIFFSRTTFGSLILAHQNEENNYKPGQNKIKLHTRTMEARKNVPFCKKMSV